MDGIDSTEFDLILMGPSTRVGHEHDRPVNHLGMRIRLERERESRSVNGMMMKMMIRSS